ncbi:thioredoxin TrxC [Tatumella sp. UBA2305]|uniref:thioredoxin TrxC n=1 Tax=Tatumella sp. UBA2305 TaxID=1947647 RepID=UPI0025F7B26B|nr:thioredoxin TrxC [Tatumella sp. UBA2305]
MNTVCSHCLATNRLPEERISESAKCGRCKELLFDGEIINATEQTLDKLLQDDLPVVIDFWAPWCGPCVGFAPVFEDVAEERAEQIRFIKVNTEQQAALSARFRIRSIPTLMIFRKGQHVDTMAGALPKASFKQWLDESL